MPRELLKASVCTSSPGQKAKWVPGPRIAAMRRDLGTEGSNWFCQSGFYRPVSKHGPRSLSHMRVCGCQTHRRNESKNKMPSASGSIGRPWSFEKGMSKSIFDRTRKMVNYAWVGWSQGKLWWKLVAVLTCKSFVKLEYRGEKPIEPSSCWFPLKFLSG